MPDVFFNWCLAPEKVCVFRALFCWFGLTEIDLLFCVFGCGFLKLAVGGGGSLDFGGLIEWNCCLWIGVWFSRQFGGLGF